MTCIPMRRSLALFLLASAVMLPVSRAQNLDWAEPAVPVDESDQGGPTIDDQAGVPGLPTDPTAVPLDGGLTLLGAAGAAYAVKRLRQRRQKADSEA